MNEEDRLQAVHKLNNSSASENKEEEGVAQFTPVVEDVPSVTS